MSTIGTQLLRASAVVAWIALLAWIAIFISGGAKTPVDYAAKLIPLRDGETLTAADAQRALWSGWRLDQRAKTRVALGLNPDVVIRRDAAGSKCQLTIAASPQVSPSQRVYISLNGTAATTPAEINHEGTFNVDLEGTAVAGTNTLSFHVPDAGLANEFLLSIALHSMSMRCSAGQFAR